METLTAYEPSKWYYADLYCLSPLIDYHNYEIEFRFSVR